MTSWTIGLIVMFAIGLAVILYGALSDRRKNRLAVRQILSPPPRSIPGLPDDSATPRYISSVQARRVSEPRPALDDHERTELDAQLGATTTVRIPLGFASDAFVTDEPTGRTVLDHPRVLVSAEPIMALRELIGLLEHMITDQSALVIAATAMAPEVLDTLEVNHLRRALDLAVILSRDPVPMDQIVAATGATLISRVDLQTGYLSDRELGHCVRWVSDHRTSFVVPDAGSDPAVRRR